MTSGPTTAPPSLPDGSLVLQATASPARHTVQHLSCNRSTRSAGICHQPCPPSGGARVADLTVLERAPEVAADVPLLRVRVVVPVADAAALKGLRHQAAAALAGQHVPLED